MFYSLTGKIIYKDEQTVAISCGGVGFKSFTTRNSLAKLSLQSGEVTVFTHLNVREDALDLFGFATNDELDAFKLLITVSGVGPKAALAILSELSPDAFAVAVASGDTKAITAANGVGPKLAQRVIMELKDKNYMNSGIKKLDKLFKGIEAQEFDPKPSPLCHWCEFCKTNKNALEEKNYKYLCPYHSLWTRENPVRLTENVWLGLENHEAVKNSYLKKLGLIGNTTEGGE